MITSLPSFWRAYNDLQSGSFALSDLKENTEKLAASNSKLLCLRALLTYGEDEEVVTAGGFHDDFAIEWQEGVNHTQVCKPREDFTYPLRFVTYNAFRRQAKA